MKKIYQLSMLLLAGAFALTACTDDNESNPTLTQPTQFVLNNFAVNGNIDLERTSSVALTWSQPTAYNDFNAPVVPTYTVEVSPTGSFNKAFDINAEDNTGADFFALDETYTSGKNVELNAETIDRMLIQLNGWDEASKVPSLVDLSFRVKAAIRDASFREYYPIYSNVVTMKAVPYFMELKVADPEIWYLTGACIADGSWSNSESAIGKGMTPMFIKAGFEYDKKTGKGEIEYAGYFPDGANFKIIAPEGLSNWNYGMCSGNEEGGQVYREAGDDPGNIVVNEGGYYKITLNTATHIMTWEKIKALGTFTQIAMPGDYQGWDVNSNLMTALTTATENHDWVADVTFDSDPSDGGGVKFAADGSWDVNWGATAFPYGTGTQGGPNIWYAAGSYKVFFNDLLGSYMFMAK